MTATESSILIAALGSLFLLAVVLISRKSRRVALILTTLFAATVVIWALWGVV